MSFYCAKFHAILRSDQIFFVLISWLIKLENVQEKEADITFCLRFGIKYG
jgi:hypothetical protein